MCAQKRKTPPPTSADATTSANAGSSKIKIAPRVVRPSKKRKVTIETATPSTSATDGPAVHTSPASVSLQANKAAKEIISKPSSSNSNPVASSSSKSKPPRKLPNITKLAPVRPFAKVPSGSNATGPYSSRGEGKNMVGVTRNLQLGAYLRRCMNLVTVDGYRTLYLSALGAAIPHAMLLSTSLPVALAPTFGSDVKTVITTGTVQCVDEIIPDEEDEDVDEGGMQIRSKSCINIDIFIGDGERVEVGSKSRRVVKAGKNKPLESSNGGAAKTKSSETKTT